jgi:hypothetical protein
MVCYGVLWSVMVCYGVLRFDTVCYGVLRCVTACYGVLRCVTVCYCVGHGWVGGGIGNKTNPSSLPWLAFAKSLNLSGCGHTTDSHRTKPNVKSGSPTKNVTTKNLKNFEF